MVDPALNPLQGVLFLLHANPHLSGVLLQEGGSLYFQAVWDEAKRLWGPSHIIVLPHSADRFPTPDTSKAPACVLLPNAHLHSSALLQSVFRKRERHPALTFVAVYHASEGSPHPILRERASVHLPGPSPTPTALEDVGPPPECFATLAHRLGLVGHRSDLFAAHYFRTWERHREVLGAPDVPLIAALTLTWRAESPPDAPPEQSERVTTRAHTAEAQETAERPREKEQNEIAIGERRHDSRSRETPYETAEPGVDALGHGEDIPPERPPDATPASTGPDGHHSSAGHQSRSHRPPHLVSLPPGWAHYIPGVDSEPNRLDRNEGVPHPTTGATQRRRPSQPKARRAPSVRADGQVVMRATPHTRIDWNATIKEALKWSRLRPSSQRRLVLRRDDLRYRSASAPRSPLYIVVLDTSASMVKYRIEKAKGLIIALLDEVGMSGARLSLIACGGDRALTVVGPTTARQRLEKAVSKLSIGGGTPLADALRRAGQLARRHSPAHSGLVEVLIFTDGGANQGDRERLIKASAALRSHGAHMLFVDTRPRFAAGGRTRMIADALAADYVSLSRLADSPSMR